MVAAAVVLGARAAQAGLFRFAGAIIRHTGGGSSNRRGWDYRDGRGLDDNLGRGSGNIGGSVAGFFGRFIGGSAATDNE